LYQNLKNLVTGGISLQNSTNNYTVIGIIVKMDFNRQGNKISSNAQLLLMSFRDQDRQKFDTVELDRIALSKPNDVPLVEQKRGRGRPRKNPIEQQTQSKPKDLPLVEQKRGRGRPRKNPIEQQTQSKPKDLPLLQQKRGRGRPRKTVESEVQIKPKENCILDIKEKLKLLETITNGYREIERIDKETQKNVEKLCAMIHNSK